MKLNLIAGFVVGLATGIIISVKWQKDAYNNGFQNGLAQALIDKGYDLEAVHSKLNQRDSISGES